MASPAKPIYSVQDSICYCFMVKKKKEKQKLSSIIQLKSMQKFNNENCCRFPWQTEQLSWAYEGDMQNDNDADGIDDKM